MRLFGQYYIFRHILLGVVWACLALGCTDSEFYFQRAYDDYTTLNDLTDRIPAIVSLFDSFDPAEADAREGGLLEGGSQELTIQTLISVSEMLREPLPRFINGMERSVDEAYLYYAQRPEEFNRGTSIIESMIDLKPSAVTEPAQVAASIVAYFAQRTEVYPSAATYPLPTTKPFKTCNSPQFNEAMEKIETEGAANLEPGRAKLVSVYKRIRWAYCLFLDSYGDPNNARGEILYKALTAKQNQGVDFEAQLRETVDTLYKEDTIQDIQSLEEELADWFVKDPLKKQITDFLAEDAFNIFVDKEFLFESAQRTFDLTASFLSAKDPDAPDTYMLEWLFEQLHSDASNLDKGELIIEPDTSASMVAYGDALFQDANAGFGPAVASYGGGSFTAGKEKMLDLFWDGRYYNNADGGSDFFPGVMYHDGTPEAGITVAEQYSHFRLHAHDVLNGDSDGLYFGADFDDDDCDPLTPTGGDCDDGMHKVIRPSLAGETSSQAFLTNFYLHLLETYYSPDQKKWAVSLDDGDAYFGNRERSLQDFFAGVQYALFNATYYDGFMNEPVAGTPSIPFAAHLFYYLAVSGGYVQPSTVPAQSTLRALLRNSGSSLYVNGNVESSGLTLRVFCDDTNCSNFVGVRRNGHPTSLNLEQSQFEVLNPGRFMARNGVVELGWQGKFSAKQGDVENTDGRASVLISTIVHNTAWAGYGPFTVQGLAPNGSKLKYENDFYTDRYQMDVRYYDKTGATCVFSGVEKWKTLALGNNSGQASSCDGVGLNDTGYGNIHIFEKVYRPLGPSDPCWDDATDGGSLSTAKYGYIRPSQNENYHVSADACDGGSTSYQNNGVLYSDGTTDFEHLSYDPAKWARIQVDFERRDEAVRANFKWMMLDKRFTSILPISGTDGGAGLGVSLASFAISSQNGLIGALQNRSAGAGAQYNGRFRLSPSFNMLNADPSSGHIPNGGSIGFVNESAGGGADKTIRFGRTSFASTDSSITIDLTVKGWGIASFADIASVLFDGLGADNTVHALALDNMVVLENLVSAVYTFDDLCDSGFYNESDTDVLKFRKFYDRYFTTDEKNAAGEFTAGGDGVPDLMQDFIGGRITAAQLPVVPKVRGVYYPSEYNSDGSVAGWAEHSRQSEGKFSPLVLPVVMFFGTFVDGGDIIDDATGNPLPPGADSDKITIRNFVRNGFRSKDLEGQMRTSAFNELAKSGTGNYPAYDPASVIIAMIEKNAGARDGFLPSFFSNSKISPAFPQNVMNGIEEFAEKSLAKTMENLALTKTGSGTVSHLDKLRYFLTSGAVADGIFSQNFLDVLLNEPLALFKEVFAYLRIAFSDSEVVAFFKNGLKALDNLSVVNGQDPGRSFGPEDIDRLKDFVESRTGDGELLSDAIIDTLIDNDLNDPKKLLDIDLDSVGALREELEEIFYEFNDYSIRERGIDLRKKLLYGRFLDEPCDYGGDGQCDFTDANSDGLYQVSESGDAFTDYNNNGIWDPGGFTFRDFVEDQTFTDYAGINGDVAIVRPVPNFFNVHSFDPKISGPGRISTLTRDALNTAIEDLETTTFGELLVTAKNNLFSHLYDTRLDEPAFDRDSNGIISGAEPFNDTNGDGQYTSGESFTDLNGDGFWNPAEFDDYNGDGSYTLSQFDGEPVSTDHNGNGIYDGPELFVDTNSNGSWDVGEPYLDRNGNGECDWEISDPDIDTYDDLNGNGRFDPPVTARAMVAFRAAGYRRWYLGMQPSSRKAMVRAIDDLLNPRCADYLNIDNCQTSSSTYITADLLSARREMTSGIPFGSLELVALKNIVGNFLYDRTNNGYTHLVSSSARRLAPILELNIHGYNRRIEGTIQALGPEGSLRYTLNSLRLGREFSNIDLLKDVQVLLKLNIIRNYQGEGAVWPAAADLLGDYSRLVYRQEQMQFSMDEGLYSNFSGLF